MIRILRTFILTAFPVVTALAPAIAQQSVVTNRGVVELETAGTAGISVRIGEELANLIDDGATRRLVPVVGKGALQNLIDLKYLRGIDIAILPVDVPFDNAAGEIYVPTRLTAADYPELVPANQPIKTIAVGAVLAVAELRFVPERNRNVMNFVETFFTGFPSLLEPGHHQKWHDVNLAADLPGWRRYPPAEQWLQKSMQIAKSPSADEMRLMCSRSLDERRQANCEAPLPLQEKSALFQQFRDWQTGQPQ